jgi:hypothetical protein
MQCGLYSSPFILDNRDRVEFCPHPVMPQMSVMFVDHISRRPGHPGHLKAVDSAGDHFADRGVAK